MTKQASPGPPGQGDQDPWAAFGYLVAGVAFYGFIGWALGRWLHMAYLVPIGIVVGMLFGMYLVFARYVFRGDGTSDADSAATKDKHDGSAPERRGRDHRGEKK